MNIVFTLHALERMKKRGVAQVEVLECLRDPDRLMKLDDVYRAVRRLGSEVLVVVYRKEDDTVIVITIYRSSKVRKYLGVT